MARAIGFSRRGKTRTVAGYRPPPRQQTLRTLRIEGDHAARVHEVLDQVGLSKSALQRFPHEFSGGQLQGIPSPARSCPGPRVQIADEPVSALDVFIQAQVLNLLNDLVCDLELGLIFIAHELSVVAYTTSKVYVMSSSKIVEVSRPLDLFRNPQAEATQALVGAVLSVEAGPAGNALA